MLVPLAERIPAPAAAALVEKVNPFEVTVALLSISRPLCMFMVDITALRVTAAELATRIPAAALFDAVTFVNVA